MFAEMPSNVCGHWVMFCGQTISALKFSEPTLMFADDDILKVLRGSSRQIFYFSIE